MKPLPITNVHADIHGHAIALHCQLKEARYHVWLSLDTKQPQGSSSISNVTIYKNSLVTKYRAPGYFKPSFTRASSKFGAQLLKQMLETATEQNVFEKAEQKEA